MVQRYASLGVKVNDRLLLEQCGVVIDDHVNRPCRVTVTSAVPESGLEFDGRLCLGERVRISVHLVARPKTVGPAIVEVYGPIVAAQMTQGPSGKEACASFTVEHRWEAA